MKVGSAFILDKARVGEFIESLGSEMQIVAPKRQFGGDVAFAAIKHPDEISWDYGNDIHPPKRFLLPHYEVLFRYKTNGSVQIEPVMEERPQAIVGIRSCDVTALRQQERFFCSQICDPHFESRSKNTVLFSLVCNQPREECFCICCDSGPYLFSGYDVQLTDLGDRFLYEVGSEKGAEVSAPREHLLANASEKDLKLRDSIWLNADAKFQTTSYLAKAILFISANEVPQSVWDQFGAECFRCGSCTNLCPVCSCFNVEDTKDGDGAFTRWRYWDSCQFAGFTREASGYNPRATFGSRVQRRFYHKASYQYITRDGRHGCVGCGRCVVGCMADLGVPSVVKRLRRAVSEQAKLEAPA